MLVLEKKCVKVLKNENAFSITLYKESPLLKILKISSCDLRRDIVLDVSTSPLIFLLDNYFKC
jgi:hypothetical protein